MKILKPGKVKLRKFVCSDCRREFVLMERKMSTVLGAACKCCPTCGHVTKLDDGEPYEEPTQDKESDALRLYKLMKGTWPYSIGELEVLSTFLAANGVTFREG